MAEHVDNKNVLGRAKAIQACNFSWDEEVPFGPKGSKRKLNAVSVCAGCKHDCLYCWAKANYYKRYAQLLDPELPGGRPWGEPTFLPVLVDFFDQEVHNCNNRWVLLSNVCDPFGSERAAEVFPHLLASLLRAGARPVVLTKAAPFLKVYEYFEGHTRLQRALKASHTGIWVGVTITTLNSATASFLEPGAPSPEMRFGSLERLGHWSSVHAPGKVHTFISLGGVHKGTDVREIFRYTARSTELYIMEPMNKKPLNFPWDEWVLSEEEMEETVIDTLEYAASHRIRVSFKDDFREILFSRPELIEKYELMWGRKFGAEKQQKLMF